MIYGDYYQVTLGGRKGFVDQNNNTIVPIIYDDITWIANGYYYGTKSDGTVDCYNPNFKLIVSGEYDDFEVKSSFIIARLANDPSHYDSFTLTGYNERYFTPAMVQQVTGNRCYGVGYQNVFGYFEDFLIVPCYYREFTHDSLYALYGGQSDKWLDTDFYSYVRLCPTETCVIGDVVNLVNNRSQYVGSRMISRDGSLRRDIPPHANGELYVECNEYNVVGEYTDGSGSFVKDLRTGVVTKYRSARPVTYANGVIVQDLTTGLYGLYKDGVLVAECKYSDYDYTNNTSTVTMKRGGTEDTFEFTSW